MNISSLVENLSRNMLYSRDYWNERTQTTHAMKSVKYAQIYSMGVLYKL